MRRALLLLILAGCGAQDAGPSNGRSSAVEPPITTAPPVTSNQATPAPATVELTAVTLADDCGGSPPQGPPAAPTPRTARADSKSALKADRSARGKSKRRCEQTSMQLAISASTATRVTVTSVELLDESGASLGILAASAPTKWSDAAALYQPWDEQLPEAGTAMVSYVLAPPDWDQIGDRWDRTFTLKAVISVGGTAVSTTREVTVVAAASLPPNVKT